MKDYKTIISKIDLTPVLFRMIVTHCWSRYTAEKVKTQYIRFLYLKAVYGKQYSLPPSIEIDEFWHNHILFTEKYHRDCKKIFGKFLHHNPAHGQSVDELKRMFDEETQSLYFREFGEYIYVEYKFNLKEKLHAFFKIFVRQKKS